MSSPSTNYRESVFRHPDLTRIHGEPNFSNLKVLTREIKANAKSVHSTLGGAAHGHLGLVLSAAQYALISATAFTRVVFPEPLAIPIGTTRLAADELERNHKEQVRIFREFSAVENALKTQLTKAIDSAYLSALLDPITYDLQGTIYDNLRFLMTTYGKVTPDALNDEFDKVNAIIYNPALPIDTVFNAIIEVSELAEAAGIPYSEQQQITMCYNVLNRSGRMTQDIKEWNRRPALLKTWVEFRNFFRRVHAELRETESDTLQTMQHANIARQVIEGIAHLIPPQAEEVPTEEPIVPDTPAAFAVTEENVILPSLIQQMTQMQTMMLNMQQNMCGQVNNPPPPATYQWQTRGRNRGRGTGRGRGRGRGRNNPMVFTKYCWTHGLCMHEGTECVTPDDGHQPTATATNHMGGSNRNCG